MNKANEYNSLLEVQKKEKEIKNADYCEGFSAFPELHSALLPLILIDTEKFPADKRVFIKVMDETKSKTIKQNNAIHALMQELYISGATSSPAKTFKDFRKWIKGEVICKFEIDTVWHPIEKKFFKRRAAKSIRDYTIKDGMEAIKLITSFANLCECWTKKMDEIRNGLEGI